MRLQRVTIQEYKNLKGFDCTFSDSSISAFIGNNGSGKSNLLEAITEVFSFSKNYASGKNSDIVVSPDIYGCTIEYECEEKNYVLHYSKSEVTIWHYDRQLSKREMLLALPSAILLYYAGETRRQKSTALSTYDDAYDRKLSRTKEAELPGFKFMDYYSTDDLSLLLLTATIYKGGYYDKLLRLLNCTDILSNFSMMLQRPKGKNGAADIYWNATGFVKYFLDELRKNVSRTMDRDSKYFMDFNEAVPIKELSEDEKTLFLKLKAVKNAGYLEWIDVQLKKEDGVSFASDMLSEGEKQLSLLLLLLSFTAQDSCLYLFDEFDAFLHLNWQKTFSKMIEEINTNGHIIFTTHSPATISGMQKKNVYIMTDGKVESAPSETYNRSLDEIMEEHMLVSMRPHEYVDLVQVFRESVMQNRKDLAEETLIKLREIIGETDPFFITARIALNRME